MRSARRHRASYLALVVAVVFVAIVVPTCQMIGCSMNGAMPFGHMDMPGFFGDCGGTYVTNSAPSAIVPPGADAAILAMLGALLTAIVLFRPPMLVQTIRVHESDPPPPPEDPRGERLRL